MGRDYDEEMGSPRAPRSRRNISRRKGEDDGLKVMNDSSIHPVRLSGNGAARRVNGGAGEERMAGNTVGRRVSGSAGGTYASGRERMSGTGSVSGTRGPGASGRERMSGTGSASGTRGAGVSGRERMSGTGSAGGTRGPGASGRERMSGSGGAGGIRGAGASTGRSGSGSGRTGLSLRQERQIAKRRKRRRIIAMILAECLALVCIFGYAYFLRQWNQLQRPEYNIKNVENKDISFETVEKMKGYWTIAVFGVDARSNAVGKGTNADVNIICNINLDTGEIKLVSVFRDSYLNISENGSYNKINEAYFLGGPEQAVAALNRNLDLNISDYMTFNWKAVADAINILGGVDIELSKAEFYYINSFITETVKVTGIGSYQLKSAGMNHLDGVQAVAYGRLRLMDTDFARTERQRKVIQQAFDKARQADFNTLKQVLGTVFPQVATSINVDDIFLALPSVNKYHIGETMGFPQARGDARMGKKGAVVVPQTLESNVIKLHEFLFGSEDYTPSDTVKKISTKISADSGMYKEGTYVEKVRTDSGVIQQPKATTGAVRAQDDDEEPETTKRKTEETSRAGRETDEDGNYLDPDPDDEDDEDDDDEPETDRYGRPLGLRPGMSVPETDESGNPVDPDEGAPGNSHGSTSPTQSGISDRPGDTTTPTRADESEGQNYPGGTYPGATNRPGDPTESTSAGNPGTTWPGGVNPSGGNTVPGGISPGGSSVPGSTNPAGGTNMPGTTSPTGGAAAPGGTSPTGGSTTPGGTGPGGIPTNPTGGNTGPGTGQVPGQAAQIPGSSGGNNGPSTGPVSAPGQ